MASPGDVFRLTRRVGFGDDDAQHVVILQAARLNAVLPTIVVAPIDESHAMYAHNPLLVPVSAGESGLGRDGVVVLTAMGAIARLRLEGSRVGRLEPSTLATVHHATAILLGLAG